MIRQIAEFIDHPLTDDKIDIIARHCAFDSMRDNPMVNREVLPVDVFDMTKSKFMRKGIVGDWRNHFSDDESKLFDDLYENRLCAIGLELAYN